MFTSAKECQITFYGPTPPPVCNTYLDENGQEQEECYQLGSPAAHLLLNKQDKSYSDATYGAIEYHFEGTCNCTLKLWSAHNFKGASKTYAVNKFVNKNIFVEKTWKKDPKSFKVSCRF